MKDSVPVWDVVAGMALGAVVGVVAARETLFAHQSFDIMLEGREAAIMHLVLRVSIKSAAVAMSVIVAMRRCVCKDCNIDLWVCLMPIKVAAAIIASSSLCMELELMALRLFPVVGWPIVAFGGWRAIQLADLVLTSISLVFLVVLADYIHRKIAESKSWKRRVVYVVLALAVFGGLASFAPWIVRRCVVRDGSNAVEEFEKECPNDVDYRLDADEPWEMNG